MKNLFGRFFRASNAIEKQVPGTGLGLSIVQAIVEGHQGTMHVTSRERKGTRVALSLPHAPLTEQGLAVEILGRTRD